MTVRGQGVVVAALAALLGVGTVAPAAAVSDPSTSPSPSSSAAPSADPELMQQAQAALAEQDAKVERATITDEMRADSTVALRADDSTFVLDPADSTTTLEKKAEEKDDTVVTLTSDLLFDFGKAALTPEAEKAVAELAGDIPQDATVRVDGHTDSIGTDAKNLRLSKQRANAVADVLGAERPDLTLKVKGHGEANPVADNEVGGEDNPAGRALNRRVEVTYPTA
ncbi:OmpA family protein [Isoptericola sp. NPDC019693]|uniref:OmpA family protein n=1 Tax=Isoptericola sp. NPDC019693 TaxID=3364009 RepID=UPI0037AAD316